jgi:cytochrome c oxidase subunit 2
MRFPVFPAEASKFAREVDVLYFALLAFSVVMVLVVMLPMFYFIIKYRRGKPANRKHLELPHNLIEVTWITLPLLCMMVLFGWASRLYFNQRRVPDDAMEINAIGKQWMWKIQHPEGNREINELHVPLGRIIKMTLASQDVIHSFFLPEFRIKQDVIPGYYTTEWFKPTKLGTFHIFCAEYCGNQHSGMIGKIVVMAPADYQKWLEAGKPGSTLAESGEKRFRELGCSGCHMGSSVVKAPPMQGLFGKPVPLQSGQIVTADEGYIRDSIVLPASQITAGYQNVMPSYQGKVTEEELVELIAYIKSLGTKSAAEGLGSRSEVNQ